MTEQEMYNWFYVEQSQQLAYDELSEAQKLELIEYSKN
jgi:hypothetical protein